MPTQITGIARHDFKNFLIVGCPLAGTANYSTTSGINVSTEDFEPAPPILSLRVCAGSGNIAIEMLNGGVMVFPLTVDEGTSIEICRGHKISKVLKQADGTTFNGAIFPLF